jgi:hypothetical protein
MQTDLAHNTTRTTPARLFPQPPDSLAPTAPPWHAPELNRTPGLRALAQGLELRCHALGAVDTGPQVVHGCAEHTDCKRRLLDLDVGFILSHGSTQLGE